MAERKATAWSRAWLLPASVAIATAGGAWTRMEYQLRQQEEVIDALRADIGRTRGYGPNGFRDPEVHCAHDLQIQHWLEQQLGHGGWRKLQMDYANNSGGR